MLMAVGSDGGTLCHLSGHVHAWFAQERREPSQGGADTVLDSTSSVHNHACEAWASFRLSVYITVYQRSRRDLCSEEFSPVERPGGVIDKI